MPQVQLPIFPEGVTRVTDDLGFEKRDGKVVFFNGTLPVFTHAEDDLRTFRMVTSQFVVSGHATQAEIARAFGVSLISVKRSVKRFREGGAASFYAPRKARGPAVLTASVIAEAQRRLDDGESVGEIGEKLAVKPNTVSKAIGAGRLHRPSVKKKEKVTQSSSFRKR